MFNEIFECTSHADVESYEFEIKWNLHKEIFQMLIITNGERISSTFQTKFYNSKWYLKLQTTSTDPQHFGFFVFLEKADIDLSFAYCYSLKSGDKELSPFNPYCKSKTGCGRWGYNQWKNIEDFMAESNWPTDFLTIIVKIKVTAVKEKQVSKFPIILHSKLDIIPPTGDFSSLIQTGSYSDVTLIVGGKTYKAHKAILATRCIYFASIFSSTFKEATESKVTIEDFDPDDFDYILHFIYSGQHPKNSKTTGLLMAADRLGLPIIVLKCEEYFLQNITVDNCLNLYHVADLCSRDSFKSQIKAFMKNNMEKVVHADSWKQMKKENNILLTNLFESVFKN